MNLTWINSKIKKMSVIDVQLIKLSVFAFTLLIAKLWEPILSLEWYWYAIIFVIATTITFYRICKK
jgi:hypothetical protein